jgi:hypothetical protein
LKLGRLKNHAGQPQTVSNAQTFPRDAIGGASSRYPEKSKKSGCRLLLMSNVQIKNVS